MIDVKSPGTKSGNKTVKVISPRIKPTPAPIKIDRLVRAEVNAITTPVRILIIIVGSARTKSSIKGNTVAAARSVGKNSRVLKPVNTMPIKYAIAKPTGALSRPDKKPNITLGILD